MRLPVDWPPSEAAGPDSDMKGLLAPNGSRCLLSESHGNGRQIRPLPASRFFHQAPRAARWHEWTRTVVQFSPARAHAHAKRSEVATWEDFFSSFFLRVKSPTG